MKIHRQYSGEGVCHTQICTMHYNNSATMASGKRKVEKAVEAVAALPRTSVNNFSTNHTFVKSPQTTRRQPHLGTESRFSFLLPSLSLQTRHLRWAHPALPRNSQLTSSRHSRWDRGKRETGTFPLPMPGKRLTKQFVFGRLNSSH